MIDSHFVVVDDKTISQKDVDKLTCQVCSGIARNPQSMCGECEAICCDCCMHDIISNQEFKAPPRCQGCGSLFSQVNVSDLVKSKMKELKFKSCQNCSDEFPDNEMDFDSYKVHLIRDCNKIQAPCPFKCGAEKVSCFQRYELKEHLYSQTCPNFSVICSCCH